MISVVVTRIQTHLLIQYSNSLLMEPIREKQYVKFNLCKKSVDEKSCLCTEDDLYVGLLLGGTDLIPLYSLISWCSLRPQTSQVMLETHVTEIAKLFLTTSGCGGTSPVITLFVLEVNACPLL